MRRGSIHHFKQNALKILKKYSFFRLTLHDWNDTIKRNYAYVHGTL
jgi:hypothetical protein